MAAAHPNSSGSGYWRRSWSSPNETLDTDSGKDLIDVSGEDFEHMCEELAAAGRGE